jgi:hypothetical protein
VTTKAFEHKRRPVEPGLAIYTFTVDGVMTPDPNQPAHWLRARTPRPGGCRHPPELWGRAVPQDGGSELGEIKVTGDTRITSMCRRAMIRAGPRDIRFCLLHGNNDTASGWTDAANFISTTYRRKKAPN